MTSAARVQPIGAGGGGLAQAPTASMRSTSSTSGVASTIASVSVPSIPVVQGIRTSASNIRGGVTATQMYTSGGVMKRIGPGGNPGNCDCDWQWDETLGKWVCTKCGSTEEDEDYFNENHHNGGDCPCYVPLNGGMELWMFMGALAAAYVVYKTVKKKETQTT